MQCWRCGARARHQFELLGRQCYSSFEAWVVEHHTIYGACPPGCLEAIAEPRALQLAFWTLHRPPNASTLTLALRLLHALSPTPAAAWAAAAAAGALYSLSVLMPTAPPDEANRVRS